jgi:predicted RecA/RadA family phage recombinase
MNNYLQPGSTLTFVAPGGGVTSGTPVLIQGTVVVPAVDAAATASFEGAIEGTFSGVLKAAGATWTVGQTLYFDSADSTFKTAQSATARRAGIAAEAALIAATTGTVKLVNIGAAVNVA